MWTYDDFITQNYGASAKFMAYTILHLSRNNQRTHLIVDDVTTLPVMFATIYGMNELSKKSLGTQENILCSLRFFYVYYYKKHKQTFGSIKICQAVYWSGE